MNRIWRFSPWFPHDVGLDRLVNHCAVLNSQELLEGRPSNGLFKSKFPTAQLKLTLKSFEVDCFYWESCMFVSERMRSAMALSPSAIQYFDVDAAQSASLPKSMNYNVMSIPVIEEVSDPKKSKFLNTGLELDGIAMPFNVESIAIRSDAAPTHDLFHDKYFRGYMFCTDSFALRLLHAGCTGVRFFDSSQLSLAKPMRFRTLRGLEEQGEWDPIKKVELNKLVEAVD